MPRSYGRFRDVLVLCGVAFAALSADPALAQQAGPAHASDDGPPPLPPTVPANGARDATMEQLAERLRRMEETNKKLAEQLERSTREHDEQMRSLLGKYAELEQRLSNGAEGEDSLPTNRGVQGSGLPPSEPGVTPVPGAVETGDLPRASVSRSGGIGVPGGSFPPVPRPQDQFDAPGTLEDKRGRFRFGPGFELMTDDAEFILQFHNLTQIDYRGYLQGGQESIHDTFGIPRQRWIFSGHITKEIGFMASLQQGFESVNGLDMFLDLNYDRRLQFRMGRFKTPFTYEFFIEPIQGLITPERSLFFNNFGQNRDVGLMAYGQLFNGPNFDEVSRVQYAAGIFNGNRNGLLARQDGKFLSAYVNAHPFGEWTDSLLENFNIGGSVFTGTNAQPAVPSTFRTIVPTTGNFVLGVPFLTLNAPPFRQQGPMALWDLHTAWFYRPLAVIAELLGVPREDWEKLFQWTNETIGSADPEFQQGSSALETVDRARLALFQYFTELVEQRRKQPKDDLTSFVASAQIDGKPLPTFELLSYFFLLVVAGNETTRNATTGGLGAFIDHPDQWQRLKQEPSLLRTAVEEIVRWTSPVIQFARTAAEDTEVRGQKIPAGQSLCLFYPSANRDEEIFDEPFKFDIGRNPNPHLAFGIGEHFCLGANLARLELEVIFRQLLARLQRVELAGPIERLRSSFVGGIKHMPIRYKMRPAA